MEHRDMGAYIGKGQPVALIETFARFQVGFLSSEDFHRISLIFTAFHRFYIRSLFFISFHRITLIFMDFGAWVLTSVSSDLLPLQKPLLDSRLASYPLMTSSVFILFSPDFQPFTDFLYIHRFL